MSTVAYKCDNCEFIHDYEYEAQRCCSQVSKVYLCDECKDEYETRFDADNCCAEPEAVAQPEE